MTGDNFCKAAEESFFLSARNAVRLGIVHGLGSLFSLVGEVFISAGTAFFAYVILTRTDPYKSTVSTPAVPTIVMILFRLYLFLIIKFIVDCVNFLGYWFKLHECIRYSS